MLIRSIVGLFAASFLLPGLTACHTDAATPSLIGSADNTISLTLAGHGTDSASTLEASARFAATANALEVTFEVDGDCFVATRQQSDDATRAIGSIAATYDGKTHDWDASGSAYPSLELVTESPKPGTTATFAQTDAGGPLGTWQGSVAVVQPVQLVDWPWQTASATNPDVKTPQSISHDVQLGWHSTGSGDTTVVQILGEASQESKLLQCAVPSAQQQLVISKKLLARVGVGSAVGVVGNVRRVVIKTSTQANLELLSFASAFKDDVEQLYFPIDLVP